MLRLLEAAMRGATSSYISLKIKSSSKIPVRQGNVVFQTLKYLHELGYNVTGISLVL